MCQATAAHGFPDLNDKSSFDFELLNTGQVEVGLHAAETPLEFNATNQSSFRFRNSFTSLITVLYSVASTLRFKTQQ